MIRPRIGQPHLLVYRECVCGNWCATGEGANAPICAACGTRMVPGGGGGNPALYGRDPSESRRIRCMGFAALFTGEQEAVGLVAKLTKLLGWNLRRLWGEPWPERYYTEGEVAKYLSERGFPTEKVWGPLTASPDLGDPTDEEEGGPPWEREGQTAKAREWRGRRAA